MKGITPIMRREYTSNVYLARNVILRPDGLTNGVKVKEALPLEGSPYDWLMWIDSDAIFKPDDVWRLLKHDLDICAGSAVTNPQEGKLSWGNFNKETGACDFATRLTVPNYPKNEKGLVEVEFTGFHWVLIKAGVFEKIEYPWFRPTVKRVGGFVYFPSEDISWSMAAMEKGFKIYVDPECKIGHEKSVNVMP
jgi:GT2 family glycosyltransferase